MTETTPLESEIRRRIEAAGPMPIGEYMALCLFDPVHGYYTTREPFGAAGDFITNPQSIAKMAKSLPKGWETKNIEIVLRTAVKNQVPSPPEIVAAYCW